jgi:hypothetical protein
MNDSSLIMQVLKGLSNLFYNNLCQGFFDAQLPTLVVVVAEEISEIPAVAVFQNEVIVVIGPILTEHPYDSLMLHLGENKGLIKNII